MPGARRPIPARLRGLLGSFAVFHAGNMAMIMAIGVLMLLVLSRILPGGRYAEVVFMTAVGLYFVPFDTALGKAGFAALRAAGRDGAPPSASTAQYAAAAVQVALGVATAAAVASWVATPFSQAWFEDALYMGLCRLYGVWSCHMQPAAWALGVNLAFVRLTSVVRLAQIGALGLAMASGSFLAFGVVSVSATFVCIALALRAFAGVGAFRRREDPQPVSVYLHSAWSALMATGCDVLAYNAPYLLVSTRFGIGPMLIVFDSVMKVSRIAMTGARTLSEISLPRQTALHEAGDRGRGLPLLLAVIAVGTFASACPAALIAVDGRAVFHLLLGANDVVPDDAMLPSAALALALGFYQAGSFFLGYANDRPSIRRLTAVAALGFSACAVLLIAAAPSPAVVLSAFAADLGVVGVYAAVLSARLVGVREAPSTAAPAAGRGSGSGPDVRRVAVPAGSVPVEAVPVDPVPAMASRRG